MSETIQGRLNVNWDAYWKGFMSFPAIEVVRFALVKGAYNRLLRAMAVSKNPAFCELGAGTASISRYLGDHYKARTTIVDSNPQALQLSSKTFYDYTDGFEALHRDVFDLADRAHQFDLVHSGGLIEHFIDDAREKIVRVHCDLVKDKGYILILVPTHNFWYKILNEGVFNFFHLLDKIPEVPWSLEELTATLRKYGFKVLSTTSVVTELGVLAQKE